MKKVSSPEGIAIIWEDRPMCEHLGRAMGWDVGGIEQGGVPRAGFLTHMGWGGCSWVCEVPSTGRMCRENIRRQIDQHGRGRAESDASS